MNKITYVIVFRHDLERFRLLQHTVANLRNQTVKDIEIILSGEGPTVNFVPPDGVDRVIHQHSDEAFSRAKSANFGVLSSITPYVVIHDGDILVPPDYTERLFEQFDAGYEVVHLSKDVMKLDREATDSVLSGVVDPWDDSLLVRGKRRRGRTTGLSLGVNQASYIRLGGMNEDYVGWGSEDAEFVWLASKKAKSIRRNVCRIIHLWHPTAQRVLANKGLYQSNKKKDPQELADENHKVLRRYGRRGHDET